MCKIAEWFLCFSIGVLFIYAVHLFEWQAFEIQRLKEQLGQGAPGIPNG